jgi:myo-inositol catabolism protein IolS
MRTIRFGRTNAQVPAVSLGTWGHGGPNTNAGVSVGWTGHDDALAKDALLAAYRHGITHWDTADAYGAGHAEQLIGEMWGDVPRDAIFLATKYGYVGAPSGRRYDPAHMRSQLEASLRNMKTDRVDLHYFHNCNFGENDEALDDAIATMRSFLDEGKVRYIGLSDWDASLIMKFIERVDPDVVQPYRNVVDDDYESSGLKAYVDAHDLGVAFFSPLKHGLLLGKYEKAQQFPEGDFRRNVPEFEDQAFVDRMKRAKQEVEARFPDQPEPVMRAIVGALLTGNPTACVLLGQRNPKQVEAAARIGEALSDSDAAWVKELYRSA